MLIGDNVRVRPFERKDTDSFYSWMSCQENLGGFMDALIEYKEEFTDNVLPF